MPLGYHLDQCHFRLKCHSLMRVFRVLYCVEFPVYRTNPFNYIIEDVYCFSKKDNITKVLQNIFFIQFPIG